jgi:hypothetical protein
VSRGTMRTKNYEKDVFWEKEEPSFEKIMVDLYKFIPLSLELACRLFTAICLSV